MFEHFETLSTRRQLVGPPESARQKYARQNVAGEKTENHEIDNNGCCQGLSLIVFVDFKSTGDKDCSALEEAVQLAQLHQADTNNDLGQPIGDLLEIRVDALAIPVRICFVFRRCFLFDLIRTGNTEQETEEKTTGKQSQ